MFAAQLHDIDPTCDQFFQNLQRVLRGDVAEVNDRVEKRVRAHLIRVTDQAW